MFQADSASTRQIDVSMTVILPVEWASKWFPECETRSEGLTGSLEAVTRVVSRWYSHSKIQLAIFSISVYLWGFFVRTIYDTAFAVLNFPAGIFLERGKVSVADRKIEEIKCNHERRLRIMYSGQIQHRCEITLDVYAEAWYENCRPE